MIETLLNGGPFMLVLLILFFSEIKVTLPNNISSTSIKGPPFNKVSIILLILIF
jgi:hypothetical protein